MDGEGVVSYRPCPSCSYPLYEAQDNEHDCPAHQTHPELKQPAVEELKGGHCTKAAQDFARANDNLHLALLNYLETADPAIRSDVEHFMGQQLDAWRRIQYYRER